MASRQCSIAIFGKLSKKLMVDSFNYALQHGSFSISQRQGVISLSPKKIKKAEYLTNWRPVSLLHVDFKIETKTIQCSSLGKDLAKHNKYFLVSSAM